MTRLSIISEHGPWILRLFHVTRFIDKKDTKLLWFSTVPFIAAIEHERAVRQQTEAHIYQYTSHVSKLDDGLI